MDRGIPIKNMFTTKSPLAYFQTLLLENTTRQLHHDVQEGKVPFSLSFNIHPSPFIITTPKARTAAMTHLERILSFSA